MQAAPEAEATKEEAPAAAEPAEAKAEDTATSTEAKEVETKAEEVEAGQLKLLNVAEKRDSCFLDFMTGTCDQGSSKRTRKGSSKGPSEGQRKGYPPAEQALWEMF